MKGLRVVCTRCGVIENKELIFDIDMNASVMTIGDNGYRNIYLCSNCFQYYKKFINGDAVESIDHNSKERV